ncbi:MAG TPA: Ig-like domain-containing protein [Longimicrobium sp.]|jgi:hypothetical protein|uniref:Ig-like domain-containing protein n=1 Tax=Longimicrobium sp. TaxID=2029185 RepID=UPI002EDA77D6
MLRLPPLLLLLCTAAIGVTLAACEPAGYISFLKRNRTVPAGDTAQIVACWSNGSFWQGHECSAFQDADHFQWTSLDPAVATVGRHGVVTAHRQGAARIQVTRKHQSRIYVLNVVRPVAGLRMTLSSDHPAVGDTVTAVIEAAGKDGPPVRAARFIVRLDPNRPDSVTWDSTGHRVLDFADSAPRQESREPGLTAEVEDTVRLIVHNPGRATLQAQIGSHHAEGRLWVEPPRSALP